MPSQIPNNKNYSLPERLPARRDFQPGGVFYTKPPRKKRPLGWKIGLGIGAAILLLTFVLFNQQIGQLLNWIGIKAQKPGGPQITLFLDPVEQGGGPSDTVQYTVNIQIEQGTYLNALDPLDPNNGAPLPFLGDISFNVDNLASLYPEFIESANITVPIEDPALPGNNPAMPWITVLDDVNAFGLLTNRRLTPPDLGFITTPPILTITLKNYPLEHGGFPINFQVGATVNYLPSMGVISVTPPPGQEPTVDDPIPANGILNLEGGIPPQPDFSLVITPKTLDVNSGETAVYDIAVGSLNDFSGDVVLTVPGLDGYKITCLDGFTLLPGTLTLAAGETKHSTLTIFTTSGLKDIFTVPIQVHGSSMIWILELDPDTGGTKLVLKEVIHDDNATLTINPLQDYSLAIVPPTITIAPGGTAVYTIELTRTSNFTGPVTLTTDLTIPSLNPNLESAIFSDTILEMGDSNPTLTLQVKQPNPDASINFKVFGDTPDLNGSPAQREAGAQLNIVNTPDYTLEVKPDSQGVFAGGTATYTITATPLNGFSEPIQLQDDLLSNFGTYVESVTYDINPITTATAYSTAMHIKTKTGVTNPGFDFTVTGVGTPSGLTRSDQANLAIGVVPDYSLVIDPLTRTVAPGGSTTYIITLTRIGGFSGDITLSTDLGAKPGVQSAVFNPVVLSGGILTSILTVTASSPAADADHLFVVVGSTLDLGGFSAQRQTQEAHFIIGNTPDFAITIEPPKSQTVNPGGAATYHILLSRLNNYRDTVTLTHNLTSPFVASAVFDDAVLEDGDNDAYLTVTATNPADDSNLPFDVTGTGIVEGIPADRQDSGVFIIQNLGDYRIAIDPSSRTVAPGGNTTYTVTLTRLFGFTGNVTLTTDLGSKAGVQSAIFNPAVLTGGVLISTLSVIVNNPAANAIHLFTVYGDTPNLNGSPAQRTAQATLIIRNTPDFAIEVTPDSLTVAPGGTAVYDVALVLINGYTQRVTLSNNLLANYGAYIQSADFDELTLDPANLTTQLRVTAKSGIDNQDILNFVVTGSGLVEGILTDRSDTADLLIRNLYDYRIAIDPASRTVSPGGTTTYTITLTRLFGFAGDVTLTTDLGTKAGVQSAIFNPVVLSGSTLTSALTVTAANPASDVTHTFIVYGNTPNLNGSPAQRTAQAIFIIENDEDFSIAISPKIKQVAPGGTTIYNITATRVNGFTGDITLSTNLGSQPGIESAQFTDGTLNGIETTTTLTVITLPSISTIDINFLVYGSGAPEGVTTIRQDSATLSVVDFRITIDPDTRTVLPGNSTTYTINLERLNGFTGTVNLTTDLGSKPYIESVHFDQITLSGSETSTIMTVNTLSPAPDMDINFTVSGNSAVETTLLTHQDTAVLRLFTPTTPDFTITVTPKTRTVNAGNSTTYDVTLHRINGFDKSVTLSTNLLADNPNYIAQLIFDLDILPAGTNDQTTVMHVTTKNIIGNIDLPFTVIGKETATGSPERSDNAVLSIIGETPPPPPSGGGGGGGTGPTPEPVVTPPATGGNEDYTIKVDPITTTTIYPGQSATYKVAIIRTGGFTGAVSLTTDILRLNADVASATFAKTTIPSEEDNTTLVLVARPGATIDSHTIFNVQGTSVDLGDRKDDDQVNIIVPALPSTGPAPSPWFWLVTFVLTWISWQQLHMSYRARNTK